MLKRVLVVVLAKRVAPPRPSKSTKMASPSSMLAHASNASLASTIAPLAPSPKANNSGFIETLNPSVASQDVALFFCSPAMCSFHCAHTASAPAMCSFHCAHTPAHIGYFAAWAQYASLAPAISPPGLNTPALPCYVLVSLRAYARRCASRHLAQIVLLEMHEISSTMRKSRFSVNFFSFVVQKSNLIRCRDVLFSK